MEKETINLGELAKFLVRAKTNTYASLKSKEIKSERPNHKELEFEDGDFYYRDSYIGFFQAPGMEEVRLGKEGKIIWTMAYSGGMLPKFHGNLELAKDTFTFFKKALNLVNEEMPYRGPKKLKRGNWEYSNSINGDIKRFSGNEKIFFKRKEVFNQEYIGGLVVE